MGKLFSVCIATLFGCVMMILLTGEALADKRVALVVGNSQYKNPSLVLSNPKNDAEDVAAALRTLGFEVIHKTDLSKRDLELAMGQFARLSTGADAALFFYAGHALQHQGQNYLMPVDAALEDEISLRYQMISIDDVRAALDRTSGVKIMILDACRNNPVLDVFKRRVSGTSRNVEQSRGLARIDKTQGMVVSYATSADDVAADGTGRNSPYTAALLKRLQEPGIEIEVMFRRIAADVNEVTNGRQRPETSVSLLSDYYLNQLDRQAWEAIQDSNDPAKLSDFLRRFPSSILASQAQGRLQAFERQSRERTEKELAERQAAQRRQEEEQRARLAAVETERAEREAAQRRLEREQAQRLAGVEREQQENSALQRLQAEQRRLQAAEAERQRIEREKAVTAAPAPASQAPASQAPASQEQACKRDADILARLRASPVREDVIRFERELGCERLRAQVLRLRESLGIDDKPAGVAQVPAAPRSRVAVIEPEGAELLANQRQHEDEQKAEAERQRLARESAPRLAAAPVSQEQACKLDAEKLTRLRASQKRDEVVRFERELACEKLRAQVLRLRESLAE